MIAFVALFAAIAVPVVSEQATENMTEVQLMGFENMKALCERKFEDDSFVGFTVTSNSKETSVSQTFQPQLNSQWPSAKFEEVGDARMLRGGDIVRIETRVSPKDNSYATSIQGTFEINASMKKSKYVPKNEMIIDRNGSSLTVPCIFVFPSVEAPRKGKKAK